MSTEQLGHAQDLEIGNYANGEIPDPLQYLFLDWQGSPIDLSTGTVEFHIERTDESGTVEYQGAGSASFETDGTDGKVVYVWTAADFLPGSYRGQFWVTKSPNVFASQRIRWFSYEGIKA